MARMLRSTTLTGTILLAAALALSGCATRRRHGAGGSPSASASADEISAGAAAGTWGDADDTTQPSLELAEDGTLSGTDGCNQLSGQWTENGVDLTFENVASARSWRAPTSTRGSPRSTRPPSTGRP